MRSDVDDGWYINPAGGEVRGGDWVTIWVADLKFDNPRTIQRYEQRMRLHVIGIPVCKLKLKDVGATTIRDCLAANRKGTRPSAPWLRLHGSSPAASPDARPAPHS
ncbi:hypothetical protein [Streptomyces sp. NPDC029003]|uniref:hypothetical protein n=1 Tax=Streptomyces sp. NPDC029003 TaxID=3155125 RepID=UPI0033F84648